MMRLSPPHHLKYDSLEPYLRFLQLEQRDRVGQLSDSTPADDPLGESMRRLLGFVRGNSSGTGTRQPMPQASSHLLAGDPSQDRVVETLRRASSVDEDTILLNTVDGGFPNYGQRGVSISISSNSSNNSSPE